MRTKLGRWETTPNLYPQNGEIGQELTDLAIARGLRITRYVMNYGRTFDGWTKYAVYAGSLRPQSTLSHRILHYTRTRHSKYGEPSIVGERRALADLMAFVTSLEEVSS